MPRPETKQTKILIKSFKQNQEVNMNTNNNKFKLCVFIFIASLCLLPFQISAQEESIVSDAQRTISMDFQDASLKDVLKLFSIQSGMNFIASEAVQDRKLTLYLDKVSVKEAMDKLFIANNLYYELEKDANILIVKDRGKPEVEVVTHVFYLKYATVSSSSLREEMSSQISPTGTSGTTATSTTSTGTTGTTGKWATEKDVGITKAVRQMLSSYGSVIEEYRTNSLIVIDIPSRMPIIAQTIASLDVPVPQVMLEVEMLDVSKGVVDKVGFEFSDNPITLILPGGFIRRGTEYFIGTLARRKNAIDSSGVAGSVVLGSTFGQILDFFHKQTDTKFLARPRILTLNNETAEIKIATSEMVGSIKVTTTAEGASVTTEQAERVDTGVSLRVTPQISIDTGEITMFIVPTVKDAVTSTLNTSFKDPEERSTKSIVRIKDGETMIIGGLIRNEFSQSIRKLPILGDIPVLGALFRHKDKDKDKQRELLVFITPRIIKDATIRSASAKNIILPEREQTAASLLYNDRHLAIGSILDNFEKKRIK